MNTAIRTYAFINAKLRARLSKLLPQETINRLAAAHSLDEALGYLRDTPYEIVGEIYKKTGDLKLGELELFRQEVGICTEILKYINRELTRIIRAMAMRYEVENLKNGLRLFFDKTVRKRSIENAVYYLYREPILHDISIDKIINAGGIEQVIDALDKSPYADIVRKGWPVVEQKKTIFFLEVELDRYYYSNLMKEAKGLNRRDESILRRLIGVEIDLLNINWIIRIKSYYSVETDLLRGLVIPGGHSLHGSILEEALHMEDPSAVIQSISKMKYAGILSAATPDMHDVASRLSMIENILHEIMIEEARKALAGYPFTIGIIISYFVLKRNEIKRIQTILNAKQYGILPDRIRGLL